MNKNMYIEKIDISEEFVKFLEAQLTKKVSEEFDNKIKELQEKKDEIISGIILNAKKNMSVETKMNELIITVKEIKL